VLEVSKPAAETFADFKIINLEDFKLKPAI